MISYQARRTIESLVRRMLGWIEWTDWTPTVTQSASVSLTITEAKYALIGKACHIYAKLVCTSAGTAANAIVIGGIPAAAAPALTNNFMGIGTGLVRDTGTVAYHVVVTPVSSSTFRFYTDGSIDFLGLSPAYTIADTDEIGFSATYRVA